MRVLVAAMPFAGHVQPMTAVAAELAARGHEVTAYTGTTYGQRFADVGAARRCRPVGRCRLPG